MVAQSKYGFGNSTKRTAEQRLLHQIALRREFNDQPYGAANKKRDAEAKRRYLAKKKLKKENKEGLKCT